MRDHPVSRLARALLAPASFERWFTPAFHDLLREHLPLDSRRRRGAFALRATLVLLECCRLSLVLPSRVPARGRHAAVVAAPSGGVERKPIMWSRDLHHAWRLTLLQPMFTVIVIAVLGGAVAAVSAVFTIVNAVVLAPLPFPGAEALVAVSQTYRGRSSAVSPVNYNDWRRDNEVFTSMGLYRQSVNVALAAGEGGAEPVSVGIMSASMFDVLGVTPAHGRFFVDAEDREGGDKVVVLGHGLWQRRFGGRPSVIGDELRLDGDARVIVGVAPEGFAYPEGSDVWIPLEFSPSQLEEGSRGAVYMDAVARLAPGVSLERARSAMATIGARLAAEYPRYNAETGVEVVALVDRLVGSVRQALLVMLAAVFCVLLVAVVNVAGLFVARASARRHEMSVRLALGASRGALVRQLFAESVLLAAASAAAGLVAARWLLQLLLALAPQDLPRTARLTLDSTVVLVALALTAGAALVLGLAPGLAVLRDSVAGMGHARGQVGAQRSTQRLRRGLVIAQVAVACVLLVAAGLAVGSLRSLLRIEPGFEPAGVLTFEVTAPTARYATAERLGGFYRELVARLAEQPGVESVGAAMSLPLAPRSGFSGSFEIEGAPPPPPDREPVAQVRAITPGYLETLRVSLVDGRALTGRDTIDAPLVALVSEAAARQFWPGENVLGKRIRVAVNTSRMAPRGFREIVGVVRDVRFTRLDAVVPPLIYVPHAQYLPDTMSVVIRGAADPETTLATAARELAALDKDIPLTEARLMDEHVARALAQPRFAMRLLTAFAGMALALAALGLYGVVSYAIGQRAREIGLRLALGSSRSRIVGLVVRMGLGPVMVGTLVGLLAAALVTRTMAGMLVGTTPLDPVSYAGAAMLLVAAAGLACVLPAWRALAVNPVDVLRAE